MASFQMDRKIEWHGGGPRPVPYNTLVDVQLRNGQNLSQMHAGSLDWRHKNGPLDIVAYWQLGLPGVQVRAAEPEREPTLEERCERWMGEIRKSFELLGEKVREVNDGIVAMQLTALRGRPDIQALGDLSEVFDQLRCRMLTTELYGGEPVIHVFDRCVQAHLEDISKTNLEKESDPEIRPESKAEMQSDLANDRPVQQQTEREPTLEDIFASWDAASASLKREKHLAALWDGAQSVVLDGVACRTNGVDHCPRKVARDARS